MPYLKWVITHNTNNHKNQQNDYNAELIKPVTVCVTFLCEIIIKISEHPQQNYVPNKRTILSTMISSWFHFCELIEHIWLHNKYNNM